MNVVRWVVCVDSGVDVTIASQSRTQVKVDNTCSTQTLAAL